MRRVDLLVKIAKEIHEEGFSRPEAYPLSRWNRNGWPAIDQEEYRLIEHYIRFLQKCKLIEEREPQDE